MGFTSSRTIGRHFFIGRPSTGFKGKGFMKHGLAIAMEQAPAIMAREMGRELTKLQSASFRKFADSPTAGRMGVQLKGFQNVSTGVLKVDVRRAIGRTFEQLETIAKNAADQRFRLKNKGKQPILASGKRQKTESLFSFETKNTRRGSGQTVLFAQFHGSGKDIQKLVALEFGLRAG